MKPYPNIHPDNIADMAEVIRYVQKERKNDINDFDNLKNVFISGRKVARIPSGSADVLTGDVVGDFNYDISYMYILVDNAGTNVWRRVALSSW